MRNALRAVGLLFASSLLLTFALPSEGVAAAGDAHVRAALSVCYETENSNGDWLTDDQGCNNDLVAPSGGLFGLSVRVTGVANLHVLYQAFSGGVWSAVKEDGDEVSPGAPIQAIRIKLAPREDRHIVYTTFSTAGTVETKFVGQDNAVAGNLTDTLTKLRVKITT